MPAATSVNMPHCQLLVSSEKERKKCAGSSIEHITYMPPYTYTYMAEAIKYLVLARRACACVCVVRPQIKAWQNAKHSSNCQTIDTLA